MSTVYEKAKEFKKKYPFTIAWRLRKHAKIIDLHLNSDEEVKYVFAAQKGASDFDIITTYICVLTNKRLLLAQKRLLFGYFFIAITPDLFNDFKVKMGVFWGDVCIDTMKELVVLSNIQKSALPEIETKVTEHMMREKKKYTKKPKEETK